MVQLELKAAGLTRRRMIDVEPRIEVSALHRLVEEALHIRDQQVRLVFKGRLLPSSGTVNFEAGDSLLVTAAPKAPPSHLQSRNEEEEDDLKFKLPESASPLQRRLVHFLRHKLKVPDILLMVIFSLSLRTWFLVLLWFILARFAHQWELIPLYLIATIFCLILVNLGKRQEGDISAYSIFNENFQEIPGTFNAERLDRDLRAGMF